MSFQWIPNSTTVADIHTHNILWKLLSCSVKTNFTVKFQDKYNEISDVFNYNDSLKIILN